MNKLYKEKLNYLRDNPDKLDSYAGYFYHGMWRRCKKCKGTGYVISLFDNGRAIKMFCSCVHKNVKKEIAELEENGPDDSTQK